MPSMESERDWADLPNHILTLILHRLNAGVYHLLLRAVCPAWRSGLPLESPKDNETVSEKIFFHVSPLDDAFNSTTSSWIIQVEQVGPNKWSFFHPMTGNKLLLPPQDHHHHHAADSINLLDHRITEVGRSYGLKSLKSHPPVRKIIRSSLVYMALFEDDGKLVFYKPGLSDYSIYHNDPFEDIIVFNQRFYAVNARGILVMFDPSTSTREPVPIVVNPVIENGHRFNGISGNYMHLVVSQGRLYLVNVRSLTQETRLNNEVYVLRELDGTWVRVTTIGDQVFFICHDASFALSSDALGSNCNNYIFVRGCRGMCAGIYVVLDTSRVMRIQFLSPDEWLFWPPPRWVVSPAVESYWLFGLKIPVEMWSKLANGLTLDVV